MKKPRKIEIEDLENIIPWENIEEGYYQMYSRLHKTYAIMEYKKSEFRHINSELYVSKEVMKTDYIPVKKLVGFNE